MLSFRQVNLRKSEQASVLLGQELEGAHGTVCLVTEPFSTARHITGMPHGVASIYDKSHKLGPRAGILFSKDLVITALETHCTRDCAAASRHLINGKL